MNFPQPQEIINSTIVYTQTSLHEILCESAEEQHNNQSVMIHIKLTNYYSYQIKSNVIGVDSWTVLCPMTIPVYKINYGTHDVLMLYAHCSQFPLCRVH